ncbi:MAG: exodeoxyribonuclease III [Gammaproteobacteria bacterium]|jgi:exodeoxyribonuclease-3|nr:exodeoxyribonuclease III [Gammaproteobacteria bacterium]
MRIITLNCNGIRAAYQKGLYRWVSRQSADFVCLQETKAKVTQLDKAQKSPRGWHTYFMDAVKPGYSGVAIFSRHRPDAVVYGLGSDTFDNEGRYLQLDFGRLSVASLYLPSGSSGVQRQQFKFDFLDFYMPILKCRRKPNREYVLCGDWNIAHKKIDIRNWRSNQKNSGFLPRERAWMDELFGAAGYVDGFRVANEEADQYTWWSNRGQAWAKNVGWRIDYQVVTPTLGQKISGAAIYKRKRFSDHAPLTVDYAVDVSDFAPAN